MCSVDDRNSHSGPRPYQESKVDIGSSLAPHTTLLMSLSGPTGSIVTLHGLTKVDKMLFVEASLAIYSYIHSYVYCHYI